MKELKDMDLNELVDYFTGRACIVTARVGWNRDQVPMILWYLKACGVTDKELVIQANKDYDMEELWDDRVVQVITNTGDRADGLRD